LKALLGAQLDVFTEGAHHWTQVFTRVQQAVEGGEDGGVIDFDDEGHDGAIP
jgi:hypothetical protein